MVRECVNEDLAGGTFPNQSQIRHLNDSLRAGPLISARRAFMLFFHFEKNRPELSNPKNIVPVQRGLFRNVLTRVQPDMFLKDGFAGDQIVIQPMERLVAGPVISVMPEVTLITAQGMDDVVAI